MWQALLGIQEALCGRDFPQVSRSQAQAYLIC